MISGERVRQLRELQGLTQSALAREIPGLTQPQLSRIEAGLSEPDREVAELIALSAGVRSELLSVEPSSGLIAHSPQFRSRSRLTKTDRLGALQLCSFVNEEYERLLSLARPIGLRFESLDGASPTEAAGETRRMLQFSSSGPLPYLLLAVERIGVTVLGLPMANDSLDAFAAWRGSSPLIAVMKGTPGDRVRFSVAHELGHLVLHRGDPRVGADVEAEADEFAAELLTPRQDMRSALPRRVTLSSLAMVKSEWGVSIKSLIRRAREIGLLDKDRAISLYKQMSTRGWNKQEPGFVPLEKPRAFRKLAELQYGTGPNIERMAADAFWSEELTYDILSQFSTAQELPHDRNYDAERHGNVVDIDAARRGRRAHPLEA